MGWSGRAAAPPASEAGKEWRDKVELSSNVTIDLAKKPGTIEAAQAQYREILNATPEVLADSIKLMMIEHKPDEEEEEA